MELSDVIVLQNSGITGKLHTTAFGNNCSRLSNGVNVTVKQVFFLFWFTSYLSTFEAVELVLIPVLDQTPFFGKTFVGQGFAVYTHSSFILRLIY